MASSNSIEQQRVLQLNRRDNVLVALSDLRKGERIEFDGAVYPLATDVAAKHKFATAPLARGDEIVMYGVLIEKAMAPIALGEVITPRNTRHEAAEFHEKT